MVIWNISRQGYNRAQPHRPKGGIGLRSASVGAEQTSPGRLAPPAGRKGTFDGRYGCRKCFCVTFDKSNKTAVSGADFFLPYLAIFISEGGENSGNEKND